jgi:hypothetical protein
VISAGLAIAIATLAGIFFGYQIGALVGWTAGFNKRAALADEFEPTLLSLERRLGWQRGRLGWDSPDRITLDEDEPERLS